MTTLPSKQKQPRRKTDRKFHTPSKPHNHKKGSEKRADRLFAQLLVLVLVLLRGARTLDLRAPIDLQASFLSLCFWPNPQRHSHAPTLPSLSFPHPRPAAAVLTTRFASCHDSSTKR